MVPCLDGGLLPGDQSNDQFINQSINQSINQPINQLKDQVGALQSWLEQRLAMLESQGEFEEAYALRMEMADWLLAEAG